MIFVALASIGVAVASPIDYSKIDRSPQMLQEAKANPNGWVYVIEGNYGPNDAVPPAAIAGAWKVDSEGVIVEGSFQSNPKFKSSHK